MERITIHDIGRGPTPCTAELTLQRPGVDNKVTIVMPLAQAKDLAVEMLGLGHDHCGHHHLAKALAETLDAKIVGVILKAEASGNLCGVLRLETKTGTCEAPVNIAAALTTAIHLGIPVFWDSDRKHGEVETTGESDIPYAFRAVLDDLGPSS